MVGDACNPFRAEAFDLQDDRAFETSLDHILNETLFQNKATSWVLVAHACNPST